MSHCRSIRKARNALLLVLTLAVVHTALAQDRTVPAEDPFVLGRTAYENGQYRQAVSLFWDALRADPANLEVSMYLGMAALAVRDFETAMVGFERVVEARPEFTRARLDLARSQFELGQYDAAEANFAVALEARDLPEQVRANAHSYLDRIAELRRSHAWTGALQLSLTYDSNARVSPGGSVGIPGLPPLSVPIERDWYTGQSLSLSHEYRRPGSRRSWRTDTYAYHSLYDTEDDLDLTYLLAETGPRLTSGRHALDLRVLGRFLWKESDSYYHTLGGRADLVSTLSPTLGTNLSLGLERRVYYWDENKDSVSLVVRGGPVLTLGAGRVRGTVRYEFNDARDQEETYQEMEIGVHAERNLRYDVTVGASGSFTQTRYADNGAFSTERRRDGVSEAAVFVSRRFTRDLVVALEYRYTKSASNLDLYDYDRDAVTLRVTYSF